MTDTVTVGVFSPPVLLDVARSTGRLLSRDLEVVTEAVPSSPHQFRRLLDGGCGAILTSPDNVLAYRYSPGNPLGATADVRVLSAIDRGLGLGLYAAPGRGAEDLRGARIGVDVPTSGFALAMYALLRHLGIRPDEVEVVALGSTPRRLELLLAGDCDATMLNAGMDLLAEAAGCVRLVGVEEVIRPYLGTVLAVAGSPTAPVVTLAEVLRATSDAVLAGHLDAEVIEAATRVFAGGHALAGRYLARLRDQDHGLVAGGKVDLGSLAVLVDLRRNWLPEPSATGGHILDAALEPDSGLCTPHLGHEMVAITGQPASTVPEPMNMPTRR